MAKVQSNAEQVGAWIEDLVRGFVFTRPGVDRSLGEDLAAEAARAMIDRAVPDAKGPDGSGWQANESRYAQWKRRKFDADQPGILTGQMLSLASMLGSPTIGDDRIAMTYGTGERPGTTARSGAAVPDYMRQLTDREKAEHFTSGGRAFYGLDDTVAARVIAVAERAWEQYLTRAGAG